MTRLISALILALALLGGWGLYRYWENMQNSNDVAREAVARAVMPEQLPGMPAEWEPPLQAAEQQGPSALRKWLKTYGSYVQDPRKAWIELDYCVLIARESPNEAKQIFAEVKQRTSSSSPVWPRIHDLEKTYE